MAMESTEAQARDRGPLKLCGDCREWIESKLMTSNGINLHLLTLVLVTGGRADIVGEDQCDACKAKRVIEAEKETGNTSKT